MQKEKEHLNKGKFLPEYSLFIVREKFCVMSKGNTRMNCGMLIWKFLPNWDIFLKVCGILLHLKKYIHLPHICKYLTSNFVIDHPEVCYLRTFQNFLVVLMLHLLGVGWLDLSKLQRSKFGLQTWFVNTLYKYSKNLLLQIFNFPALWHAGLKFPFLNEKHFTTDWQEK